MVTVVIGSLISATLFLTSLQLEENKILLNLNALADESRSAVQRELDGILEAMYGVAGLFAASKYVDSTEFRVYFDRAAPHREGIRTLTWIPRVSQADLPRLLQRAIEDGYTHFEIKDENEDGKYVPAPIREEYFPIYHFISEEIDPNLRGLDLGNALPYARLLKTIGNSGNIMSVNDARPGRDMGDSMLVEVVMPLYRYGLPNNTVMQRRESLIGFILLETDVGQLMEIALQPTSRLFVGLDLYVFERDGQNERLLRYFRSSRARPAEIPAEPLEVIEGRSPVSAEISLANRQWQLLLVPIPGRHSAAAAITPWIVLVSALLFTILAAAYLHTLQQRRWQVEVLAAEREVELGRSRGHFRTVLDTAVDAIITFNRQGIILDLNPATERIFGYARSEAIGQDVNMLVPGLYNSEPENDLVSRRAPVNTPTGIVGLEREGRRKEGSVFPIEASVGKMQTNDVDVYTAIARDVTERKNAQRQLQQTQERLDLAIRGTNDGLWDWNIPSDEVWYAPRFKELLGYSAAEFPDVFASFESHLHPDDHDATLVAVDRHLRRHETYDVEYRLRRKTGEYRWFRARGQAVWDGKGNPIRMAGSIMDITERREAAEQLMTVNAQRQAILNGTNYSIISTDPQGTIQTFNIGAQHMLGYSEEEVVDKVTPALIHDQDEVIARAQVLSRELNTVMEPGFEVFVAKARKGIPDENEWTYIAKDGRRIPVVLSVTALKDDEERIIGFMGIASDISERKKVDRMKDEFISTVSHELRTPLTSIRGSLGLLRGGTLEKLPDQSSKLVDIAYNNCERLLLLINDILDISKIESGKMKFEFQVLDVNTFLKQAVTDNKAYGDEYKVRFKILANLPNAKVFGDHDRLMQVMSNLLSNAAKFSPHGGKVDVGAVRHGHSVRISVTDCGPGIPKAFQRNIFDRFSQADSSDTRQVGGTGLGLNISKAIVEKHGGNIGFVTQPHTGTTFYFDLPERAESPIAGVQPPERIRPAKRILICEDDADIATLLRMVLSQAGYGSDIARDADEARRLLDKYRYAAMTLDITLPGKDGITLYRELRDNPGTMNLPIVVISAKAGEHQEKINGGAVTVVDWIKKPIDKERMLAAISRAVHKPNAQGRPTVLHVEDENDLCIFVQQLLQNRANVVQAPTLASAIEHLNQYDFDLILLDIGLSDGSGLDLLKTINNVCPQTPVVVFSAYEIDSGLATSIRETLVKSQTSNEQLLNTIMSLVDASVA